MLLQAWWNETGSCRMKGRQSVVAEKIMSEAYYDPVEREREKQAARDADERNLVSGLTSRDELSRHNAFVPPEMARDAIILEWKELD